MKKINYSPDHFMSELYGSFAADPYKDAKTAEDASAVSRDIREKAKKLFPIDMLLTDSENLKLEKTGNALNYPEYTLQKYSFTVCENLVCPVFILTPKNVSSVPGVVTLCGHGYGVRQILNISKSGRKKHIRYIDNYQKNFAVELAKRGCVVVAPELFGFGEARLKKDLIKPFYISSCDELSHHLLPYGLTTACIRVLQAVMCVRILETVDICDKSRIGCMGISGGGLTALYASVLEEKISRTVISGYINTFRDSIFSMWHCPDNYIPGILTVGEIYDFASSIAPRELFIESGTKDKLFPIEGSRLAHDRIRKIYSLMGADDRLHTDIFEGKHSVCGRKSFDFLSR